MILLITNIYDKTEFIILDAPRIYILISIWIICFDMINESDKSYHTVWCITLKKKSIYSFNQTSFFHYIYILALVNLY